MSFTKCALCGGDFSGAACVKCGAPAPKRRLGWGSALVAGIVVVACISGQDRANKAPEAFDDMAALAMCQSALKRASKDPEKAEVPYVANQGSGDRARFVWGPDTKMARMRNGFGLEVATSAACSVTLSTKQITSLTLDGLKLK